MPTVDLATMIKAAQREVGLRRHVYPNMVRAHKTTQAQADLGIAAMEAIVELLQSGGPGWRPVTSEDLTRPPQWPALVSWVDRDPTTGRRVARVSVVMPSPDGSPLSNWCPKTIYAIAPVPAPAPLPAGDPQQQSLGLDLTVTT